MTNYEKEIVNILNEADKKKGLPVRHIARQVFNMTSCDMFNMRPYDDVYSDVAKFLRKEASFRSGIVETTDKRGYYRINRNSQKAKQLILEFRDSLTSYDEASEN